MRKDTLKKTAFHALLGAGGLLLITWIVRGRSFSLFQYSGSILIYAVVYFALSIMLELVLSRIGRQKR